MPTTAVHMNRGMIEKHLTMETAYTKCSLSQPLAEKGLKLVYGVSETRNQLHF